jgi:phage terminase large subunit-like protein
LQVCIDKVEAAPLEIQSEVKFDLPCGACPENTGCLNAKRKELGSLMYAREIQTRPMTSDSSLFGWDLMAPMLMAEESLLPYWHKPSSIEGDFAVVQAWDLAWSERTGGDWLVCMTGYVHRWSGRRHLLDIHRWRRVSFDDQVKLIENRWAAFKSDLVVIESDAAQQIWTQHMSRNTDVPVMRHAAGGKQDLAAGVPGLLILLENHKWEFPYAQGYHRDEMDNWLSEMEAFGWNDGKLEGVGEHDDTVMAFWHLNWGLSKFTVEAALGPGRAGVVEGSRI